MVRMLPHPVSGELAHLETASASARETFELGALLGVLLAPGDVVPLWGGFGAGKTTFAQGVGHGLGVTGPVVSPSFGLIHMHAPVGAGPTLHHLDLYRIGSAAEAEAFGIGDVLGGDGATLIEWPRVIEPLLPRDRLDIVLDRLEGDTRLVRFRATGMRYRELLAAYSTSLARR